MSAFLSAGESLTPSPVTATMAPCRWHPSTMISFCWGDVRANTISGWLRSMSSMSAGVMSRRSEPCTTHAFALLHKQHSTQWQTVYHSDHHHQPPRRWSRYWFTCETSYWHDITWHWHAHQPTVTNSLLTLYKQHSNSALAAQRTWHPQKRLIGHALSWPMSSHRVRHGRHYKMLGKMSHSLGFSPSMLAS